MCGYTSMQELDWLIVQTEETAKAGVKTQLGTRGAKAKCDCGECSNCRARFLRAERALGRQPERKRAQLKCGCGTCNACRSRERWRLKHGFQHVG